jgi:hypothetical protein
MASDPPRPDNEDTPAPQASPGRLSRRPAATRDAPARQGRLDLGDAIHDGWQAFCRAPRVFVLFTLLVNLLLLALQPLMAGIGSRVHPSSDPLAWLLFGLALLAMVALNLWAQLSLVGAARLALDGRRPTLAQLLRAERSASLRLLRAWLRLAALMVLPFAATTVLFGLPLLLLWEPSVQQALGLSAVRLLGLALAALGLVSLALSLATLLYLAVNQAFLPQIVMFEGGDGAGALKRGRRLVDPQWPLVLLLVIITAILQGLGLLVCMVGSLVAWPAVVCIGTAAYEQLCQSEQVRHGDSERPAVGKGTASA